MATTQLVQRKGIFHGLPVHSDKIQGLNAVVTGANGISGYHMVRVLAESPQRWKRIYCLSRRPPVVPGGLPDNAEFVPCDFLKGPREIAKVLADKNVQADYVFFYSYIQPPPKPGGGIWSDAEQMTSLNSALLENFLNALGEAGIKPERIMLQTGAKNYGLHLGPVKNPCEEWDARVTLEPNFYYQQEDLLWSYCKNNSIGWNIAMPGAILGAVPDAAMNLCLPLAVYATVCKHLNQPLVFHGDIRAWQATTFQSSAMLNAYLEEWMVLSDDAKDQKFNAVDNSGYSPESFWPKVADWYGIEWKAPGVFRGDTDTSLTEFPYGHDPPPRGYGARGCVKFVFLLSSWAKQPEVQQAWKEIAQAGDLKLREIPDPDQIFAFADQMILGDAYFVSMDKSRKLGWHGFVDSSESILQVFREFAELKMIPPVPEARTRFL